MSKMAAGDGIKVTKRPPRITRYDNLYLGDGAKGVFSMDPRMGQSNNNVLVIAGTGGGKTKSVVEANLLHAYHQSLVVLLTKRRLLQEYAPLLEKNGYKVMVLDLVHPERSDVGYDPLLHIKDDSDIRALAKQLMVSSGCGCAKDPYWEAAPASLMRAFVKLARHKFGKQATMNQLLELFRYIGFRERLILDDDENVIGVNKHAPAEDFEDYKDSDPDMYLDWCQYDNNHPQTRACIEGILTAALATVTGEDIRQLVDKKPQLSFPSLVDQKSVLFILTSPVNPAHHPFANLVLGTMFKELFEYGESQPDGRLPNPLTAICDDFATGGQIPNFEQHISIFREKGISVMMLIQSLSQLESMYGKAAANTISENTDNKVFLGTNDLKTARLIAEWINKPVDEVLSLPIGQEYLIRRGAKPIKLNRYQILKDPVYKQEIEPNSLAALR